MLCVLSIRVQPRLPRFVTTDSLKGSCMIVLTRMIECIKVQPRLPRFVTTDSLKGSCMIVLTQMIECICAPSFFRGDAFLGIHRCHCLADHELQGCLRRQDTGGENA